MAEHKSSIANRTALEVEQRNFGILDSKGREIGAWITIFEIDFEPAIESHQGYYQVAPGHYFASRTQTTRDGVVYGPSQPMHFSSTVEERAARIAKYLAKARQRAAKKTGGAKCYLCGEVI